MHVIFVIFLVNVCYSSKLWVEKNRYKTYMVDFKLKRFFSYSKKQAVWMKNSLPYEQYHIIEVPQQTAFLLAKGIWKSGMS